MSQSEVKARLRPFGFFFEKSLTDLIKGIRAHKDVESQLKFLQNAINECRSEVKSSDMDVKTMAVLKLSYLEMYGFDMSWANFHVLEVMSSSKFQQKRVGYLAASQCFRNDEDVLMLTTNLLKKDLNSNKSVETGVAISGISNVVTRELAADVVDDLIKMLNHSKPYIRKKAVLAMYKIFLKYPEALRTHLNRITDKLDDDDESVVTATVTVICELSKKTPKILVNLAPLFYQLLQNSNNNWMLIRILKLFSSLTAVEPRLKHKLLNPVLELMSKTKASSLVFECVNCLVMGDMIDETDYEVARLCLEELVEFFQQNDSNLRYVGLLAFLKIGKINPKFIASYSEYILQFIEDEDVTIREKSLGIVQGVVDDENCFTVVKKLMLQLVPEESSTSNENDSFPKLFAKKTVLSEHYKHEIVYKILEISSMDNYTNIPSFEWYLAVISDLIDLSIVNNLQTGDQLGEQLRDIAVRVPSVRKEVVGTAIKIINNKDVLGKLPAALKYTIWLAGEYSEYIKNGDIFIQTILSNESRLELAPYDLLELYIPALVKIYSNYVNKDPTYWDLDKSDNISSLTNTLINFFEKLSNSKHFEVQERSVEFLEFFKVILEAIEQHDLNASEPPLLLTDALPSLFNAWELNPISLGSQQKLADPDFDLDTPINEEIFEQYLKSDDDDTDLEEFEEELYEDLGYVEHEEQKNEQERNPVVDELKKKEREERLKDDPYYLSSDNHSQIVSPKSGVSPTPRSLTPTIEVEDKPVRPKKKKVLILTDEVIGSKDGSDQESLVSSRSGRPSKQPGIKPKKRNLLGIDSSTLENFDFDEKATAADLEGEIELAKLRDQLEQEKQQQEQEEVIVVRKKKKEKKLDENGNPIEKKKKKKKKITNKETHE
ncbi:unnamed protein product [Cyberlindnera jadinii]|uniref:AP-3 complex subunit delta n=1 Tax=Cyberlindnera jadinii (strain ATCC 18201 / CBS 1600 / BCRC 20928 / JCM 3617 / NBRC 0987 / NRRL Y-1542) TaxID=983966 RepID=A0A0H5C230_CYBJN|nr:unnamed protein product [Cyberlindnera jadinii]